MAVASDFRKVQRQKVKAAIMIEGLQGTGKSGLALALAFTLTDDPDKVFAIDTENQSLDLYDKLKLHTGKVIEAFNKVDLSSDDGYAPSNYDALRHKAIDEGADVLIIDSISHMWSRKGGLLDSVSAAQQAGLDNYRAWGTEKNRSEKEMIFDLVRSNKVHTITTVRTKEKFGMEMGDKGKNIVVSLGEQQIQQEGLKYEPDLVIKMISPGDYTGTAPRGLIIKSRYPIFRTGTEYDFTDNILLQLKEYLAEGADPEELIKQQHSDYIKAIKDCCGTNATEYLSGKH